VYAYIYIYIYINPCEVNSIFKFATLNQLYNSFNTNHLIKIILFFLCYQSARNQDLDKKKLIKLTKIFMSLYLLNVRFIVYITHKSYLMKFLKY
jgi:hypothetical protein